MKNRLHLSFVTLLIFLLSMTSAMQAQVVVEARMDTASILIGEQVQVKLKCSVNANQQVTFPLFQPQQELTKGVEVEACSPIDTVRLNDGKRLELTRRYTITSFDSALYSLPPFQVKVDGKTYMSRGNIGLKVSTVPVDTTHVDRYNGPHGVVDQPFEWTWQGLLLCLLTLVVLCVVIALAVRLSDPKLITRRVVIHPPTPAHVTAIKQIEKIKSRQQTDDAKQYYMNLTQALRSYIEKRFGFNANEMTTSEIIERLNRENNEEAISELKQVLTTADLVKFAKHTTSLTERDRNLVQAMDYVQTTKFVPKEPPRTRIEYVSLSNKQQIMWRNVMRVALWVSFVGMLALLAFNLYIMYSTFM